MHAKNWMFLTVFFLLLASCNLPTARETPVATSPAALSADAMGTAVELTTIARMTELAGKTAPTATNTPASAPQETPSFTPSPTPCNPIVTANTTANIRSGPDTVYAVVGSLPGGGVANLAGRNDANTWWYIEFSGATGGHAWISGTVVTTACLPATVQVVAAPPTPQPTATEKVVQPPADSGSSSGGTPDLVATGMQFWPVPGKKNQPMDVQVRVTNSGTGAAGPFTVIWYANQDEVGCTWNSPGLAAGDKKDFDCQHTYTLLPTKTSHFWVTMKVDTGNQVAESNEDNNKREERDLVVQP